MVKIFSRWFVAFVWLSIIPTYAFSSMCEQKDTIKILLGTTNEPPYKETAPAIVLATFNEAVLGQLLKITPSFELAPSLLKSWKWDYRKKVYELTLRDDIFFHNGRKANAKDLEFALLRGFFTRYRSFYGIYLNNILGIEKINKHRRFKSGIVPGVTITGPYSVEVHLKVPNESFIYSLSASYFSLVAKEALKDDYINWKTIPIGAGPYQVVGNGFKNGHVFLEKVSQDRSSSPRKVCLYTTPNSTIAFDVLVTKTTTIKAKDYETFYSKYPSTVLTIFFHNQNELGKNPTFRKIVQASIKHTELEGGDPRFSATLEMLPKHFWGRSNLSETYDIAKAKKLLKNFPTTLGNKTWRVPVFAGKSISEDRLPVLEKLKKQLRIIGLRVEFYPSNEKFISKKTAQEAPFNIAGMVSDYVDPAIMFSGFTKNSPFEFERPLENSNFESLYLKAKTASSRKDRLKTVRQLSEYFNDNAIAVPLLEVKNAFYFRKKNIKNLGEQDQPLYLRIEEIITK